RQIPDGTLNYKGHKFGPRTALWLRDLKTGSERLLMDPIEPMVASGSKTLGILPRYKWAADGKSILIAQGGKLRRVDVTNGNVATVAFTAHVHRTISEMARKQFRITDDPVQAKFIRWPSASSDGKAIAFVAPVWSPDGRSIIVARGEGATAAGRTMTANAYYDLVRIAAVPPASGDTGEVVATVGRPSEAGLSGEARRQLLRPSFGPEGR